MLNRLISSILSQASRAAIRTNASGSSSPPTNACEDGLSGSTPDAGFQLSLEDRVRPTFHLQVLWKTLLARRQHLLILLRLVAAL